MDLAPGRGSGDAGRAGEQTAGSDVSIHRREPLPAGAARSLVWRRLAPLSKDSELVRGDEVLGEMSQATRVGFDAWGESWDLRFAWFVRQHVEGGMASPRVRRVKE